MSRIKREKLPTTNTNTKILLRALNLSSTQHFISTAKKELTQRCLPNSGTRNPKEDPFSGSQVADFCSFVWDPLRNLRSFPTHSHLSTKTDCGPGRTREMRLLSSRIHFKNSWDINVTINCTPACLLYSGTSMDVLSSLL